MMSYLHTKFHDNWISSFWGVAMTRFWDGRTDGRSDCTPRPVFAFGDADKNTSLAILRHVYGCHMISNNPIIWKFCETAKIDLMTNFGFMTDLLIRYLKIVKLAPDPQNEHTEGLLRQHSFKNFLCRKNTMLHFTPIYIMNFKIARSDGSQISWTR